MTSDKGRAYHECMEITYQDQRKNPATKITADLDTLTVLAQKAGIPEGPEVRIRLRSGDGGRYGYTHQIAKDTYRIVIGIEYAKATLSEGAQYVVNNTLLHEMRHVAQGQESGWETLSSAYEGWSETEAREYGRTIKGQPEFNALS